TLRRRNFGGPLKLAIGAQPTPFEFAGSAGSPRALRRLLSPAPGSLNPTWPGNRTTLPAPAWPGASPDCGWPIPPVPCDGKFGFTECCITKQTKPEQSNPSGVFPPYTYGVPLSAAAWAKTRARSSAVAPP